MDLARALNCLGGEPPCDDCAQCDRVARGLHADVRVVDVESGPNRTGGSRTAIGIDQVREVQREASLKPYEGRYRVFVFDGAERVTAEAANSLLKTLEEPPAQVVIVLLAPDAAALPPTVVSPLPPAGASPRRVRARRQRVEGSVLARRRQGERDRAGCPRAGPAGPSRSPRAGRSIEGLMEELDAIQVVLDAGLEERFDYAQKTAAALHARQGDRPPRARSVAGVAARRLPRQARRAAVRDPRLPAGRRGERRRRDEPGRPVALAQGRARSRRPDRKKRQRPACPRVDDARAAAPLTAGNRLSPP